MARSKEFDIDAAVDAAVEVFREHGFEGTSAQMLVGAMGIGRQSLYDTFGDKWGLYREAVRRYAQNEGHAHREALLSGPKAVDGLRKDLERTIEDARRGCLGVSSIVEFANEQPDLAEIREKAGAQLSKVIREVVIRGQAEGDIAPELDPDALATFMIATFSGIRVAARGGAGAAQLASLAELAMRAMR
ncbi:TetR/AcrR family transcriptional regulator [Phenylobacterium sp. LjRoot219]|uniref:TetR/AcrR family transcriptional regulator n=1 Tax=Phenylobacterium sp. LjRoot219 TaxID=3342283 RepID=UPI003ECF3E23